MDNEKRILGTLYTDVSDDFQRGLYPIARTIKASKADLAVVYAVRGGDNMKVKQIGNLFDDSGGFTNPQRGKIYDVGGCSPTLQTYQGGDLEPKIITKTKHIGNLNGHKLGSGYANSVYDVEGLSPTINTMGGGSREPMIVAMRGRNPDNSSDRTAGSPTEQRLEPNSQGICNTLTSVQKDNMVLGNICIKDRGFAEKPPQVTTDGVAPTLRAESHGNLPKTIDTEYRIRKLTPLECWRLMGFSDEDFHKAEAVNSNTQLYKQSGNSICKNVLIAIFGQMIPGKENVYKEI